MILYENFTEREVGRSEIASRNGIDNTPTESVLAAALLLTVNVLQPIRNHFGIPFSPQSWYRCEEVERILCGKGYYAWCTRHGIEATAMTWAQYFATKSHPKGEAADIELPGISNDHLCNWISQNLQFDQLIREFATTGDPSSGWVHVSYSATTNRNMYLRIG